MWVTTAQAQPSLRIGASLSQSGPYAELGTPMRLGYQLCVKHANERGGLLGRRLDLTVEDDRSDPAVGAHIYENLIGRQRVDLVFSPYSTPITDAVGDVIEKHRMPMIAASAASASIFRKGRKFLFQLLSPAETYAEGLTDRPPSGASGRSPSSTRTPSSRRRSPAPLRTSPGSAGSRWCSAKRTPRGRPTSRPFS